MKTSRKYLNDLIYQVTGAAIEVHKTIGPGLLESVYHKCLLHEFSLRGINVISELIIPIEYKGLSIKSDLRCDFVVEDILPLEIKAVEKILPIHEAQILTYLNLLKLPKGLMINFNNTNIIKEGRKMFVNDLYYLVPD